MFSVEDSELREVGLQGNSSGMRGFRGLRTLDFQTLRPREWRDSVVFYKVAGGADVVNWRRGRCMARIQTVWDMMGNGFWLEVLCAESHLEMIGSIHLSKECCSISARNENIVVGFKGGELVVLKAHGISS